ncbi:unnamed protein product [Allacma fusca]|uniref:Pacifastin domain-containing protein n=1 Tax=Allacma fusca TaxID=39272 RepID=A0A8J2L7P2_9HEXA|nr:unnamed protein product [Allacma fusca]
MSSDIQSMQRPLRIDPVPKSEEDAEYFLADDTEMEKTKEEIKLSREDLIEESIKLADETDPRNVTILVRQNGGTWKFVLNRFLISLASPEFSILNETIVTKFEITEVKAARNFEIEELVDQIVDQVPELNSENTLIPIVCKILNERRSKKDIKVRGDVLNYIGSHAAELLQSEHFFSLSSESLTEILSKQKLPVSSPLELFKAILKWGVEGCKRELKPCNGSNLREKLNVFMKFINFFNMTHFEFESYVQFTNILSSQEEQFFTPRYEDQEERSISNHEKVTAELFQTQFKMEVELWQLKLKITKMQEIQKLLLETNNMQSEELTKTAGMIRTILGLMKIPGPTLEKWSCTEMMSQMTGKFSCLVELSNGTLNPLQCGKYHCYGLGVLLHPMPIVINPLTREAFSFDCTGPKKQSGSQNRDRISGGFVYSWDPDTDTDKRIYLVIRFCIRSDYGELAVAFADHSPDSGDSYYFERPKMSGHLPDRSKCDRAYADGEVLELDVQTGSIRVILSMTVAARAVMKVQVGYVKAILSTWDGSLLGKQSRHLCGLIIGFTLVASGERSNEIYILFYPLVPRHFHFRTASKMPYVILKPEQYSTKGGEEFVKYTPGVGKTSSFAKLIKYLLVIWCLAAAFIIIQQTVGREMLIFNYRDNQFLRRIYIFSTGDDQAETSTPRICTPGLPYRPDDCNTCFCDDDGQPAGCTKMICPDQGNDIVMNI